jgi:tRNA (cmo5U34)-methyltransferase
MSSKQYSKKDNLYAQEIPMVGDFIFDDKVANVFPDMINRSVPGYPLLVEMIGILAGYHIRENTYCYDLGCSLGAVSLAILKNTDKKKFKIFSIDNSKAMTEKLKRRLERKKRQLPIEIRCENVLETEIRKASVVIMNLTMQFIEQNKRKTLIRRIYGGLVKGGVFILTEKIRDMEPKKLFFDKMHLLYKGRKGYSDLEISRKRTALENVLIPDMNHVHIRRLKSIGFTSVFQWFQCLNFRSYIAIK